MSQGKLRTQKFPCYPQLSLGLWQCKAAFSWPGHQQKGYYWSTATKNLAGVQPTENCHSMGFYNCNFFFLSQQKTRQNIILNSKRANQGKANKPKTLPCGTLVKWCSRDLSEDARWFCSSQFENRDCHRKYLPLRLLLQVELLVCLGWNKQKKLLLTDCHETACKQRDSKPFAQGKKKIKWGKVASSQRCSAITAL